MSENSPKRTGWGVVNNTPAKPVSFKELMQQEENKKVDNDLNEHYIENTLLDEDYLIALQLQQEFDKQGNTESEVNSYNIDDDYALALQLQLEEERATYSQQPKRQESTKIVFDRPYEYNYEPILPEPEVVVHEEVKVHHLGINSPYMGEDLGDNDDQLVRPASIYSKHDKEHIGKSARLQLSMDNKEDIEGYSMDDSSIVRMRKFYSHKKDRTLAAPKENVLTTNSTIDNNVRLLILNFINNGFIDSIGGNIQNGKEGIIISAVKYVDETNEDWFCLKIYKESTMEFKNKKQYIHGERRFDDLNKLEGRGRVITEEWARKEFNNLNVLMEGLVPCPEPILCTKNILLMRMIGEEGQAAPILKLYLSANPHMGMTCFSQCVELLFSMFQKCNLVHADFSEYNLLVYKKKVYVIDVGQSVDTLHPMWKEFLKRDIHNILTFFKEYVAIQNIEEAEEDLYRGLTQMELDVDGFIQKVCMDNECICLIYTKRINDLKRGFA